LYFKENLTTTILKRIQLKIFIAEEYVSNA
jgi:hypothetical protein